MEPEAPMEQPEDPAKEEEVPATDPNAGYKAVGAIAFFFALITILCRTIPDDDAAVVIPEPEEDPMMNFNRIATFPVCLQLDENCNVDDETVAEIVVPSEDGNTLIYTDAALGVLGFVDITDPSSPLPAGTVDVGGEPTSVGVVGDKAVVTVATSASFVEPSGIFHIIDVSTQEVLRTGDLGGQPDSVAVSPDGAYVAIAIENERDEDLNDGLLPQLPAGFLIIMDTASDDINEWSLRNVDLTGLDGVLYPTDPEPEYVAINDDNIVAVTLQENNAIVLVDLATGEVVSSFTAGSTDLEGIDIEKNKVIEQTGSLSGLLREPDAIAWIGTDYFATADEGDLNGGSRTFTIFDKEGTVVYDSGTELEDWVVRLGHHNEGRAGKKGNEPETVAYSEYGDQKLLFVNSERSSVTFVYEVSDPASPELLQVLPAGVGPEGVATIPDRNLVVLASEVDERGSKIRSSLKIFELQDAPAAYPTIQSAELGDTGKFIPFSALSALAASGSTLYSVEDSFYKSSRIFEIDTTTTPYEITDALRVTDANGVLAGVLPSYEDTYPGVGALLLNEDSTVNLDLEGIDAIEGGFWIVSEGRGTVDDEARPLESPNLLVRLDESAVIEEVVLLPDEVNDIQVRFGFEGVAVDGDYVVVTVQRAWTNETEPRIAVYDTASESWDFVFYPLDGPESQNGGWVGLSDIEALGDGEFLILERDNQGGPDAAIKRIYSIDLGDYSFTTEFISKTLVRDLMPDLQSLNGLVFEKVEGLAVDGDGNIWINNDNDGVDDNSGENLLMNVGTVA